MTKSLSAVVVTFNNQGEINDCLHALIESEVGDITVVDNGSKDKTLDIVRSFEEVILIENSRNIGYGAAVNVAALQSKGPILALNADTFVSKDALEAMIKTLSSNASIAAVGPEIVDEAGTRYPTPRRFPSVVDAIGHAIFADIWKSNPFTKRYQMNNTAATENNDVDWVSGACMLLNGRLFSNLGGFDEDFFMYMEDVDLCKRFHDAGWRVVFEPNARVVHKQGASTSQARLRSIISHHKSMLRYTRIHLRGFDRLLLPFIWLGIVVRAVVKCAVSLVHSTLPSD